jgi:hypothetical protein
MDAFHIDGQGFVAVFVDNVQELEHSPVGCLVELKVEGPQAKSLSPSANLRITCSGVCRRFFICAVLLAPS